MMPGDIVRRRDPQTTSIDMMHHVSVLSRAINGLYPCYRRIDIRPWVPTKHPYGRHSHRCTPAAAIPSTAPHHGRFVIAIT